MRKILVAIDGSGNSLRALDFAVAQARFVPGTDLHVLTVQLPTSSYGALEFYAMEQKLREMAAAQAGVVLDSAGDRLKQSGCKFELEQVDGEPASAIARRAAELGCESIIMGTHGRGQLGAVLMGSVAQRVVHHATVPVILVK